MSSHRHTYTEKRRARLAQKLGAVEACEPRAMITESLGIYLSGLGIPAAGALIRKDQVPPPSAQQHAPALRVGADQQVLPVSAAFRRLRSRESHPVTARSEPTAGPTAQATSTGDWLTLTGNLGASTAASGKDETPLAQAPKKPSAPAGGGAALPPRGGGAGAPVRGAVTPLQLPPPGSSTSSSTNLGALGASIAGSSTAGVQTSNSAPLATSASAHPAASSSSGGTTHSGGSRPLAPSGGSSPTSAPYLVTGNSSGASQGSFSHFELYTLDYNDGIVLFPNITELATPNGGVDLRAQVRGTTVTSYSWDTSGLLDANSISGTSSYRLTFNWNGPISTARTDTVTLTVTNSSSQTEVQTYSFLVPQGAHMGGPGPTWPSSLSPDTVLASDAAFSTHNASVDAVSGAVDTNITLPAYNPNVSALAITYDSLTADPRPIITIPHEIDPTQTVPSQVSAQLTFNSTAGTTWYYDTSGFIPGDIQEIGLQANATSLSTGRYAYSATVADIRGTNTTFTLSGNTDVLNYSGNAIGDGWTVSGLEQITSVSGGVILDLGSDGKSLFFSGSFGTMGGTFTDPNGEFSTLTQAPSMGGGGYTRTLTDGTQILFNSSGQETASVDRNGLRTTYAYSGGALQTITDPYNKVTTFTYSGGTLQTITDPAGRVATFTHSGSNLTGVTMPDSSTWGYSYDSGGRLTQITDQNSKVVTIAYDSAERASTVTQPDSTTETFKGEQESGWTNSGTSGSPATATLLAEAAGKFTDPLSHVTSIRDDWNGEGLTDEAVDPDGNVALNDRDINGLATITVDRLNRISQQQYDSNGNMTKLTYPDLNYVSYGSYNSFAEPSGYTDANGNTYNYTYDSNGNLTVVEDPLLNLTTMTYTADGKLATIKDARLNVTSYQYDSQDRLTTTTYPGGATQLQTYDSYGNPTTFTNERGNVTVTHHDSMNRVTTVTDALSNTTTYLYDSGGNLTAVEAPLSRTTSYSYDTMNRVVTVTDPLSHSVVTSYDGDGNVHTVTDALGQVMTYTYDDENRRTVETDPLGDRTTTTYDAEGQVINVLDAMNRLTTITYSIRGFKATETDPLGDTTTFTYTNTGKDGTVSEFFGVGSTVLMSYTYDNDDRLIAVEDAQSDITSYGYDAVGNTTTVTDPNGNTTTYAYDSRNRLTTVTDALSHSTVYGYDSGGNQVTVTDALGHTTTTAYDALNRATTVTDARGDQTLYVFDAASRNTVVVDPNGNRTTFGYDAADRLTTLTTPIGTTTYVYDADNEKTDETDANGRRTTFAYDSGGRQIGETWVGSSPAEVITYTFDADGEMTDAADANATLTFTYDSGGNQITAQTSSTSGQPNVTLTSGYDTTHDRTTLSDNLSSAGLTTFSYDSAFRLTEIAASYGGTSGPQIDFGYDSGGRLNSESRTIGGSGTAVNTTLSYDAADRLTTITDQTGGGTPLATFLYTYDAANRDTTEQDAEGTVSFTYDAINELTGASGSRTESYSFDSGGNRTMTGYSTRSGNELTASPEYTYTYDAEGNLTGETQTSGGTLSVTFSYDYRDRLTGETQRSSSGGTIAYQATYTYDALNRRIGVNSNGTHTWVVWDGQNPYAQFNGSGTLQDRYVHGPSIDELFARTDSGGNSAWYLTDSLGSVRDIVNSSGSIIDHIVYDSYGNVLSETQPANGDQFKFAGMQCDSSTGLYFDNARYYDPLAGRFVGQDPKGFGAGDLNLYRYVSNDPTNMVDPTGQDGMMAASSQVALAQQGGAGAQGGFGANEPNPGDDPKFDSLWKKLQDRYNAVRKTQNQIVGLGTQIQTSNALLNLLFDARGAVLKLRGSARAARLILFHIRERQAYGRSLIDEQDELKQNLPGQNSAFKSALAAFRGYALYEKGYAFDVTKMTMIITWEQEVNSFKAD